ncbi:hypothetical protein TSMEX_010925 [Taenia solium]|eukprot:TsM_000155800 transcript=TsM_000155800 gene=TsM_000155800
MHPYILTVLFLLETSHSNTIKPSPKGRKESMFKHPKACLKITQHEYPLNQRIEAFMTIFSPPLLDFNESRGIKQNLISEADLLPFIHAVPLATGNKL